MVPVSFFRALLVGALLVGIGACGSEPPRRPTYADIRFTDRAPLNLDVQRIDVVDEYRPVFDPPHFEMRLPVPLPHAADNWARDRLRAVGSRGTAVAAIIDATAVEIQLKKQGGLSSMFTTQVDTQYEVRVGIRVEIKDEHGLTVRTATGHAERSMTMLEDLSLDERDRRLYKMEIELMGELDRQLETQVRTNFAVYVR
jgi:hypothetical protein